MTKTVTIEKAGMKAFSFFGYMLGVLIFTGSAMATNFPPKVQEMLGVLEKEARKATDKELLTMLTAIAASDAIDKVSQIGAVIVLSGREFGDPVTIKLYKRAMHANEMPRFPAEAWRRPFYIQNHPQLKKEIREAIASGRILIGMTAEEVVASLGNPRKNNKTVFGSHISEQWVYEESRNEQGELLPLRYLYLDDGVLTSYQSSE